jgi:hypothetical protein
MQRHLLSALPCASGKGICESVTEAPLILNLYTRRRWVVRFTLWPFYPETKKLWYRWTRHFLSPIAGIDTLDRRKIITSEGRGRKRSCPQLRRTISKFFRSKKNHGYFCHSRQSLSQCLKREHPEFTARLPIAVSRPLVRTDVECSRISLIQFGIQTRNFNVVFLRTYYRATVAKQTVYKIKRMYSFIQLSCRNSFISWSLEQMQLTRLPLFHSWLRKLHHFTLLCCTKYGHIRIQVRMKRMSGMDIQYTNLLASSLRIEIHVNH